MCNLVDMNLSLSLSIHILNSKHVLYEKKTHAIDEWTSCWVFFTSNNVDYLYVNVWKMYSNLSEFRNSILLFVLFYESDDRPPLNKIQI